MISAPGTGALLPAAPKGVASELRCQRCGDVIGVYEPMIALIAGAPVRTSRAALGAERTFGSICFHGGCLPDATAPPSA